MLPDNSASSSVRSADLYPPDNWSKQSFLESYCSDLNGNIWRIWYNQADSTFKYINTQTNQQFDAFIEIDVSEMSGCIDQNDRINIVFIKNNLTYLYWYDPVVHNYTTKLIGSTVSPIILLDDKRKRFITSSDVILVYLKANTVVVRNQRERYTKEHVFMQRPIGSTRIRYFGMNKANRVQFVFYGD